MLDLSASLEQAATTNQKYFGKAPRAFQHPQDLLGLKDVDVVMISTPEHSHSPILKMAVEAGKDVYVEKPMGNVLEEAKAAREATKRNKRIVQVAPSIAANLIRKQLATSCRAGRSVT